uniref:SF3 helicase domain-containing protein n=1 Tax=Powellomyces hirtus TaxID=109895 RepID=A0A4V1F1W8_9FUNG|nr:hypothetical protein [Powellomyces hirtus]
MKLTRIIKMPLYLKKDSPIFIYLSTLFIDYYFIRELLYLVDHILTLGHIINKMVLELLSWLFFIMSFMFPYHHFCMIFTYVGYHSIIHPFGLYSYSTNSNSLTTTTQRKGREFEAHISDSFIQDQARLNRGLIWSDADRSFFIYNGTFWEPLSHVAFERQFYFFLLKGRFSTDENTMQRIIRIIRLEHACPSMGNHDKNLIFFSDCVWDLSKGTTLGLSSSFMNTYALPYNIGSEDINITSFPQINTWLNEVCKGPHEDLKRRLLINFLYLLITSNTSYQVFFEITGPGKTGKYTFSSLAMALVGVVNTHTSNLRLLQNNRFELANLRYKKLLLLPDQPQYTGPVYSLKALTGLDLLRNERKGIQASDPFINSALILITSNFPILSTDDSSGVARRRISILLPNVSTEITGNMLSYNSVNGSFEGAFVTELPHFCSSIRPAGTTAHDNLLLSAPILTGLGYCRQFGLEYFSRCLILNCLLKNFSS